MSFIKKFDMISPPITLYFKGEDQHSSIFSGILSIIIGLLILAATIYYFLGFINKDNPKSYFFTRYIEDAGDFPLNSSSIFNYIQFIDKKDNTKMGFDFNSLVAVGVDDLYYEEYMKDPNKISTVDHWIYGHCNYGTDIQGIEYLIDHSIYNNSACIRSYYDKSKDKYFNTNEFGFRWPMLEKGMSNKNSTYYGIIVQRCDKAPEYIKSKVPQCKSSTEINEYISTISLKYQIVDHYADMLNYDMPFTKYFYEITSAVTDGIYIINHLNFNPASMLTHNGFFFDHKVVEHSYFFTQNEKHTIDQSVLAEGQTTNGCLIGIYFWMQNTLQYYERTYDRFQDLLSDIGGISSILMTVAYYINLFVNHYIILLNTEDLIINTHDFNYGEKRKYQRKPTFFKKINQKENPPRRQNIIQQKNYNLSKQSSESIKIEEVNNYPIPNTIDRNKSSMSNSKRNLKFINESKNLNPRNKMKNKMTIETNGDDYIHAENNQSINNNSIEDKKDERVKNEGNKEESKIKKQNFNWFKYMWYLICCCSNNKIIQHYEKIRESLISEENIIQNYIDIYNLLKIDGINKKSIFNFEDN